MSDQLEQVLETINRVIDLSEEKVSLKHETIQKQADKEILNIRNTWQTKYNQICHHIVQLINNPEDEDLKKQMKRIYMSNTKES